MDAPAHDDSSTDPAALEPGVEVRFLTPDGAEGFTRLVRRCYGDSYDAAWVYDPEQVADRLRRGTLWSTVGVVDDGELVAHVGLARQRPDDDVAESGQAVVDPEYRGRHLFTLLKQRAAEQARARGLYGLYSEATAAHPYSQRANVALGAVETGLLLGYNPATVEYEQIDAKPHRQSVVLYYLKTNDGHDRPCTRRRATAPWSRPSSNARVCVGSCRTRPTRRSRRLRRPPTCTSKTAPTTTTASSPCAGSVVISSTPCSARVMMRSHAPPTASTSTCPRRPGNATPR